MTDDPAVDAQTPAMPFVACRSQGGPYDDDAFKAGFQGGIIAQGLRNARTIGADRLRVYVRLTMVKQMDLIAMNEGFTMAVTEEHPAMPGSVFATFEWAKS